MSLNSPDPPKSLFRSLADEARPLWSLGWPVIVSYSLQMALATIPLAIVGQIGKDALDGTALGYLTVNVSGFSVFVGMASALDTLAPQAFGANNKQSLSLWTYRAVVIMLLVGLPIAGLWLNVERILVALGQDPAIASLAGIYCKCMIFAIPGMIGFVCTQRFLEGQGIVKPVMWIGVITNILNATTCYALAFPLGFGFWSAPISATLAQWEFFLLTVALIRFRRLGEETWAPVRWSVLRDWGVFMRLAIPGTLMVCLEWWSFELTVFVAGLLGKRELGAQAIILQLQGWSYMFPLGLSTATSVRIGQHLGAGRFQNARLATAAALLVTALWIAFSSILLVCVRKWVARPLTSDPGVIKMVASAVWIAILILLGDVTAGVCGGVLRGCGRQATGAIANFVGFYCLGLPLVLVFTFVVKLPGINGILWGIFAAVISQALFFLILLWRQDWEALSRIARGRAGVETPSDEELDASVDGSTSPLLNDDEDRLSPSIVVAVDESPPSKDIIITRGAALILGLVALAVGIVFHFVSL